MPTTQQQTIVIADKQYLVSSAVRTLLQDNGYTCVEATSKDELGKIMVQNNAAMLVVDYFTFGFDSICELEAIFMQHPHVTSLLLTNITNSDMLVHFLKTKINSIMLKSCNKNELLTAIQYTMNNKNYYSNELIEIFLRKAGKTDSNNPANQLTITEIDIVQNIARGMTSRDIASHKQISYHTVMTHRKNIFRKLAVKTSSELMMYAVKMGIVEARALASQQG